MGTTIAKDITFYSNTLALYGTKMPKSAKGRLKYAGNYWPDETSHSLIYKDIEFAFTECRSMIAKAYMSASAAMRGDKMAEKYMVRWFGNRNTGTGPNDRDWWKGAVAIIGAIENFITSDINLYYRGDSSLLGKKNDYPKQEASVLVARDIGGFAESSAGDQDNIIGLCSLFFAKNNKKGATMKLKGADSVAGTLIHELSHNICSTMDHKNVSDTSDCYGLEDCLELAELKPSRAFYNADNIEYFCEDVYYGIANYLKPKTITTNAPQHVSSLKTNLAGKIPMTSPMLGPYAIPVTYKDWIQKTSRFGHTRSADLVTLDKALEAFSAPTGKNPVNLAKLKAAFNTWFAKNPKEAATRNVDQCVDKMKSFLG